LTGIKNLADIRHAGFGLAILEGFIAQGNPITMHALNTLARLAIIAGSLALSSIAFADRGAELAGGVCAGCHGADGNSPVAMFPKLASQQEVYLLREMLDYKSGKRASDIMTPLMADLAEDDLKALARFYARQKTSPAEVTNPALLPLGKQLYMKGNPDSGVPACASCHEVNGAGIDEFARVASQHVEYTLEQFRLYATGGRTNGKRIMRTIAQRMTPQETRAVAEYMASLP